MARIIWHGHATCTLETDDGTRIVIDPFITDNPACDLSVEEMGDVHYILVTHGHGDHFADCIPLAKRTGATVVSCFEIVNYCSREGVEDGHGMNIGGSFSFPFGRVKMTPAIHSSGIGEGASGDFTAIAGGFLVDLGERTFYHAGDTALTRDLELLRDIVHAPGVLTVEHEPRPLPFEIGDQLLTLSRGHREVGHGEAGRIRPFE